jgi:hypothetical protein
MPSDIHSEFAIDLADRVKAAITLRRLRPLAPPCTVSLHSDEHEIQFCALVTSVGNSFDVDIFAGKDPVSLSASQQRVEDSDDLRDDIARLVEQAEEEFVARKHRDALIDLLVETNPDRGELAAFCERAGIESDGRTGLSVEDCATITAWLLAPGMREKARAREPSVVKFATRQA